MNQIYKYQCMWRISWKDREIYGFLITFLITLNRALILGTMMMILCQWMNFKWGSFYLTFTHSLRLIFCYLPSLRCYNMSYPSSSNMGWGNGIGFVPRVLRCIIPPHVDIEIKIKWCIEMYHTWTRCILHVDDLPKDAQVGCSAGNDWRKGGSPFQMYQWSKGKWDNLTFVHIPC